MSKMNRRNFLMVSGAAGFSLAMPAVSTGMAKPRVVVIGGGAGGAIAAKYLAKDSKGEIDVTLIEASKTYYTCFFSNVYLGGFRSFASTGFSYDGLAVNHGINVVHDWALSVDGANKQVKLASGASVGYDKLVLSPGIDIKYDSVPGYSVEAQDSMPHGWKSGTQTQLIKSQAENMKEGGTYVMVAPPNPFRCPIGPYERASMVAHIFQQKNPTAKILILDTKSKFAKQDVFFERWKMHYGDMIEWTGADSHGGIKNVNPDTMEIETEFDTIKADAATVIPAQKAGGIAHTAGVTKGDWAPIVPATMASKADPNIYVLGDSANAKSMAKSGSGANSQAKVVSNVIRGELTGSKVFDARYSNTCWAMVAKDDALMVTANFKAGETKIDPVNASSSKTGESAEKRKATYEDSEGWYSGITADMFT